ncbi:palindromic element RPE4 domain-containing protein [Rickettsia sp. R2]
MACPRDLVKNTNNISIVSCFLDVVVKPRYNTERVSRAIQKH